MQVLSYVNVVRRRVIIMIHIKGYEYHINPDINILNKLIVRVLLLKSIKLWGFPCLNDLIYV